MDLIHIFRTFPPNTDEYTFFSSAHETFSRIDHILGHKSNLSKFKKIEILSSIFFYHNAMKLTSKRIKDPNIRPETIKTLEENIGRTLDDINQSKILYDPPSSVTEIKTKVNKWDLIKLKNIGAAKETISKVKI